MNAEYLVKIFKHNSWSNLQIVQACAGLSDAQLDAEPKSATKGNIRQTMIHLVTSQRGYLALLTLPIGARPHGAVEIAQWSESIRASGEGLVDLARNPARLKNHLHTNDGYAVEPWVVMLQAINHATEHREQVKSMLTALGITPPDIDGWSYAEVTGALEPING